MDFFQDLQFAVLYYVHTSICSVCCYSRNCRQCRPLGSNPLSQNNYAYQLNGRLPDFELQAFYVTKKYKSNGNSCLKNSAGASDPGKKECLQFEGKLQTPEKYKYRCTHITGIIATQHITYTGYQQQSCSSCSSNNQQQQLMKTTWIILHCLVWLTEPLELFLCIIKIGFKA